MTNIKRKQPAFYLAVFAVLLLLLVSTLEISGMSSASISEDDIVQIKGKLENIAEQRRHVQEELSSVRGDLRKVKEQISLFQGQVILTEQQIAVTQQLIDEYDLIIQAKESEISALETQEAEQYQKFYAQVRWLEETGSASYISILFQAHSFSEMLDYAMLIADIMDYSNGIISNLERLQTELNVAQKELRESRFAQAAVQEGLYDQLEELEIQKQEALKLYDEIAQVEAELASEAKRLATDEAHMSQELKAAEKQYAEQIAQLSNKGEWYWPLPGYYGITSYFGGRIHPIYGNWESHTGTDVPAPGGTEIHAAQDGVVTVSKYNVSYGITVLSAIQTAMRHSMRT